MILVSNAQYLLRILLLQVTLVALHHLPTIQIILLLATELGYLLHLTARYMGNKHLNSLRFFVPHVLESLFVVAI
jgi:hypothetical protein